MGLEPPTSGSGVRGINHQATTHPKQGCVMAPTPFKMMFSDMLTNTFRTVMLVSQSSTALKAIQCTNHNCEWLKVVLINIPFSRAMHTDDEVTARSGKASVAFSRLCAHVSEQNDIGTELKVFEAVVLPTLLFLCETWTVYRRHDERLLDHFHLSWLRRFRWQDRTPATEVLQSARMQSIHIPLKLSSSNGLTNSQEHVMRDYQRKKSLMNFRMESAHRRPKEMFQSHP